MLVILFGPVIIPVTYYILAPVRIFGYFVRQSHCVLITVGGGYVRGVMRKAGHVLTDKGWIVPLVGESIPEKFGIVVGEKVKANFVDDRFVIENLRFFKFLGLTEEINEGTLEWQKFDPKSGKITDETDLMVDWIVAPYFYGLRVEDIYTTDNVPMTFNMGILAQSFNPSLSEFEVNGWYKAFMGQVYNTIFEEIRRSKYEDLQGEEEELAKHFYDRFLREQLDGSGAKTGDSTIKICLVEYGMYIFKVQIAMLKIPKEIIEAANAPIKQAYEQEAVVIEAKMNRDRMVVEMSATDLLFQARTLIKPEEFIVLLKDPDEFERVYGSLYDKCRRDVLDGMAIKKGTGMRIFTEGSGIGGSDILNAAALFAKMSNNNSSSQNSSSEKEEKKGKIFDKKTRELLEKAGLPVRLEDEV